MGRESAAKKKIWVGCQGSCTETREMNRKMSLNFLAVELDGLKKEILKFKYEVLKLVGVSLRLK
jgi:hypothetical protein